MSSQTVNVSRFKEKIALTTYAMYMGGMEVFILSLAEGLVRRGHEVYIIATDDRGRWLARAGEVGARAHFLEGAHRSSKLKHAQRVGRFLRENGFDVVINNSSWFVQASLGMLRDEVVAISIIHNTVLSVLSLACSNERACNAFVAKSPATVEAARSLVADLRKIHLISDGIAVPEFLPDRSRHTNELAVVYCGRVEHGQKGVLLLPEIIRRVLDAGVRVRLDVVGQGPDLARLARLTNEWGVVQQVHLLGALEHEAALDHVRQADAFIMPSFYEGMPLSLVEAIMNGCVAVVSLLPGITDSAIEHGRTGFLIRKGDVEGFSGALVRLARDPALWSSMRHAAWDSARQRFGFKRMIEDYLALIDEAQREPIRRKGVPQLAPELVKWKDWLPQGWRTFLGRFRCLVLRLAEIVWSKWRRGGSASSG